MALLGIDVGGTHVRAAVADADRSIVTETVEAADGLTVPDLVGHVRRAVQDIDGPGVEAVAIGLPGPVARDGSVGPLANLPSFQAGPVRAIVQEELSVPVVVDNDVNLAALGEQRRGGPDRPGDLVFIAVGTGVGMGIVADGRIVAGAHGGAGELGLLPLAVDWVAQDPAALGPLEAVAGGAGLAARWAQIRGSDVRAEDVFDAAAAGDRAAQALLDAQARVLAMGVRAVQALLDPRLFVFGGGMGERDDVFARVRSALSGHGVPVPALEISLLGARAGLVGAIEAAGDAAEAAARQQAVS